MRRNVTPVRCRWSLGQLTATRPAEPAGQLVGDLPLHGGRVEVGGPGQPEQHAAGQQHGRHQQRADQCDPACDPRVLDRGRRREWLGVAGIQAVAGRLDGGGVGPGRARGGLGRGGQAESGALEPSVGSGTTVPAGGGGAATIPGTAAGPVSGVGLVSAVGPVSVAGAGSSGVLQRTQAGAPGGFRVKHVVQVIPSGTG